MLDHIPFNNQNEFIDWFDYDGSKATNYLIVPNNHNSDAINIDQLLGLFANQGWELTKPAERIQEYLNKEKISTSIVFWRQGTKDVQWTDETHECHIIEDTEDDQNISAMQRNEHDLWFGNEAYAIVFGQAKMKVQAKSKPINLAGIFV